MGRSPPARAQSGSRPQRELHVVGSECASRRHGRGARPGGAGRAPLARGPAPPRVKWLTGQNGSLLRESEERRKHGRIPSWMVRHSSAGMRIRRDTLRQHAVAQQSCPLFVRRTTPVGGTQAADPPGGPTSPRSVRPAGTAVRGKQGPSPRLPRALPTERERQEPGKQGPHGQGRAKAETRSEPHACIR